MPCQALRSVETVALGRRVRMVYRPGRWSREDDGAGTVLAIQIEGEHELSDDEAAAVWSVANDRIMAGQYTEVDLGRQEEWDHV